jgi:Metallo-beta-lactamase superfamily
VITSNFPIPGFGVVPINAFVLHGSEPVLVDTGAAVERDEFMTALQSVIDPLDLRWIWLTHPDFDHIGSLSPLLDANPNIRVITTFLGMGIMSLFEPLPLERVRLVNPGQQIILGERTLTAWKPPAFDNPSTTGFVDNTSGALICSDCFGALLGAVPQSAADLTLEELRQGQVFWAPPQRPTNTGPPITGAWTPCCADTGPPPTSSTSPARQPTGREEPNRNSRTNEVKEPWGPGPKVGNPRVNYSSAAAHRACRMAQIPQRTVYKHGNTNTVTARRFVLDAEQRRQP